MATLQDFDKCFNDFIHSGIDSLPSLYGDGETRGTSFNIQFKNHSICFTRKNTSKSVKIIRLYMAFELLLTLRQMSADAPKYIEIISDGCIRTFFFQLLKYFGLAMISGSGARGNKFVATLL